MNWVENLKKHIEALYDANFSKDSICDHHGVVVTTPGIRATISITPVSFSSSIFDKGMLFMIYKPGDVSISEKTFNRWRNGLSKIGKIKEEWNGNPGSNGISIVLDIPAPELFVNSIRNYFKMKDVLRPTKDEDGKFKKFYEEYDEALRKKGIKI